MASGWITDCWLNGLLVTVWWWLTKSEATVKQWFIDYWSWLTVDQHSSSGYCDLVTELWIIVSWSLWRVVGSWYLAISSCPEKWLTILVENACQRLISEVRRLTHHVWKVRHAIKEAFINCDDQPFIWVNSDGFIMIHHGESFTLKKRSSLVNYALMKAFNDYCCHWPLGIIPHWTLTISIGISAFINTYQSVLLPLSICHHYSFTIIIFFEWQIYPQAIITQFVISIFNHYHQHIQPVNIIHYYQRLTNVINHYYLPSLSLITIITI